LDGAHDLGASVGHLEDHLAPVARVPTPPDQPPPREPVDELGRRRAPDDQFLGQNGRVPRAALVQGRQSSVLRGADLIFARELIQAPGHQSQQMPRHVGHRVEELLRSRHGPSCEE
jgi:hypothetical protein